MPKTGQITETDSYHPSDWQRKNNLTKICDVLEELFCVEEERERERDECFAAVAIGLEHSHGVYSKHIISFSRNTLL